MKEDRTGSKGRKWGLEPSPKPSNSNPKLGPLAWIKVSNLLFPTYYLLDAFINSSYHFISNN